MPTFKAIYKCRQCGETYFDGETGEDIASIATCEIAVRGCTQHGNGTFGVHRYNHHSCADGSYGLADFMGFRKEE